MTTNKIDWSTCLGQLQFNYNTVEDLYQQFKERYEEEKEKEKED